MPATFTGALARRLDALSALTVVEVVRTVQLEPGCVYIGKGDADIVVARRAVRPRRHAGAGGAGYPWHPSTDRLVRVRHGSVCRPRSSSASS